MTTLRCLHGRFTLEVFLVFQNIELDDRGQMLSVVCLDVMVINIVAIVNIPDFNVFLSK